MTELDFKNWRGSDGKPLGPADYVHLAFNRFQVPGDLLISVLALAFPTLACVEATYLVTEIGAVDKFQTYRAQGMGVLKAQYWANLFLVSGLFEPCGFDRELEFAHAIARGWRFVLAELPDLPRDSVRVIHDESESEVFVTLGMDISELSD